jgi:hypothetical protein
MRPDVRGCGLGHWFVRQTLARVGVRFIECLAVMGAVNPVFERAGMTRIGRCPIPRGRMALVQRMRKLRLDPFDGEFARKIVRYPRARRLVEETIGDWVETTQGASQYRLNGRRPDELARAFRQVLSDPPVYYLWDREREFPVRPHIDDSARHRPDGADTIHEPTRTDHRAYPRESNRHRPYGGEQSERR